MAARTWWHSGRSPQPGCLSQLAERVKAYLEDLETLLARD
jgi:hypothetical protein